MEGGKGVPGEEMEELDKCFSYHAPVGNQVAIYQKIRDEAKEFAFMISDFVPDGKEKKNAIDKIEEAVMWANAGIARRS